MGGGGGLLQNLTAKGGGLIREGDFKHWTMFDRLATSPNTMVGKNVCWCCWVYHLKHFGLESSDWRIPFVQCKDAKNDSIPDRNVSGPMNKSWIVKIDFISSSTHGAWFSYLNISVAVMSACFFIYVGTERSHTHIFCLFFFTFHCSTTSRCNRNLFIRSWFSDRQQSYVIVCDR